MVCRRSRASPPPSTGSCFSGSAGGRVVRTDACTQACYVKIVHAPRPRLLQLPSRLPLFLLALAFVGGTLALGCSKSDSGEKCVDGCGCTSDGKDPCSIARGSYDAGGTAPDDTLDPIDGGGIGNGDAGDAAKDAPHDAPDAG